MECEAKVPNGHPGLAQSVAWDGLEPKKVLFGQPCMWQSLVWENPELKDNAYWTRPPSSWESLWHMPDPEWQCQQAVSIFDTLPLPRPHQLEALGTGNAQGILQYQSDAGPSNGGNVPCGLGKTDNDDDDPLHELEKYRQVLGQQMMMEAGAHGVENMESRSPLDGSIQPTSIGPIGHANGTCSVCIFARASPAGSNGVECGFCQLDHRRARQKNKMRPCKGKRERHQKFLSRLKIMIENNPHSFSLEQVELPPSIAGNEAVKARLVAQVRQHIEQVKASHGGEAASAAKGFFGTM